MFRYWLRYCIGSWVELPLYAVQTRRLRLAAACLATEGAYLVGVAAAWCVAPVATLWTLILPFFVSSLALMLGNWCVRGTLVCVDGGVGGACRDTRARTRLSMHAGGCTSGSLRV